MYARSLKGSIAPKGQQNIAQGNVFLRHAQRPSLLGLCHAVENIGEANALRMEYRLNNTFDALPSNEAKHTLINLRNISYKVTKIGKSRPTPSRGPDYPP